MSNNSNENEWGDTIKVAKVAVCYEDEGVNFILTLNHVCGYSDVPGGKTMKNEDPRTAAIRELSEEIGLSIFDPELIYLENFSCPPWLFSFFLLNLESKTAASEIRIQEPFTFDSLEWKPLEQIQSGWVKTLTLAVGKYLK